ncbi:kelch repeat-containing protein [Archangium lansingense]|uniref:Kelch repeat-containing protein n=1 Tax=Archangium lansingense TaxID=2995310 RepID=UPI003B7A20C2
MFRLPAFAVLPLVLALLVGCTDSPPTTSGTSSTGTMRLLIATPTAAPGDISRVTVTVSGSDMASRSADLLLTDGTWGGLVGELPAGPERTFLAQAFTSSDTLRYEGRAENVTVIAGATGLVSITLQELTPPPPFTNEAPVVDSLVATPATVLTGGTLSLSVTAHDPNAGDTVSYAWSAPSGTFSTPDQASTTWTAPSTPGLVRLTLTLSDSRGATLATFVEVTVSPTTGAGEVVVGFNSAPTLVGLTSSQSLLDVGQTTALSVLAQDAEGDTLGYQWSATCAGTFTGATSSKATFTPSALPPEACNNCQVSVVVKDGRGAQNTGRLALCVAASPRSVPPTVTRSFQSGLTAKDAQTLTFEVGASDPAGSALTFAWAANLGTFGTPTSDGSSSRVGWTVPVCLLPGTTPSPTAIVTNAFGLQVTRSFTVTGPPACGSTRWLPRGAMSLSRGVHTATLLSNGLVLVAGGGNYGGHMAKAEVYNPATGTWSPIADMASARSWHTATPLSNGQLLVAGGYGNGGILATAELYAPATGTWSSTRALSLARYHHTATRLSSGRVLVAGGQGGSGAPLATAEVYDPSTGRWTATGAMTTARRWHTATLLSNGKVLVAGGSGVLTAEVYDPATGTWSPTGSMATPRQDHTATLLSNGKVLVSGGGSGSGVLATAELYDPATGTWSSTGTMNVARNYHTATRLTSDKVLVAGGFNGSSYQATAEVYDPATGAWSAAPSMSSPRLDHEATLLPNGQVLVVGGRNSGSSYLAASEVYDQLPASP